jgi:hypothetical protein
MSKRRKNNDFSLIHVMEEIFLENQWSTEQLEENEIIALIPGHWDDFALHVIWHEQVKMLYLVCFSDVQFSEPYSKELASLLLSANQRSWYGHFDLLDKGIICFRYSLLLPGYEAISESYFKEVIHVIINEFEQFYPAFESLAKNHTVSAKDVDLLALDVAGYA